MAHCEVRSGGRRSHASQCSPEYMQVTVAMRRACVYNWAFQIVGKVIKIEISGQTVDGECFILQHWPVFEGRSNTAYPWRLGTRCRFWRNVKVTSVSSISKSTIIPERRCALLTAVSEAKDHRDSPSGTGRQSALKRSAVL